MNVEFAKPYVVVISQSGNINIHRGILDSLEENGVPFEMIRWQRNMKNVSIFDELNAPLGIAIQLYDNSVSVYYEKYIKEKPLWQYDYAEMFGRLDEHELYFIDRIIGNNVANIIKGRELKRLYGI